MTALVLLALAVLLGAAGGTAWVLRLQRRQAALQARIAAVGASRSVVAAKVNLVVRPVERRERSGITRLAALIGYDPVRRDQYGLSWIVVVGGCSLLGWADILMLDRSFGAWSWLTLPTTVIVGSRFYYGRADSKRRTVLLNQFPDALAMIVRAVRVGIPVPEALRAVARELPEPTAGEFDRLQHQVAIGTRLDTALHAMARRNDVQEYGFFAAALGLQAQTGGALTETLENLADIIRRRITMRERGYALSSEARTSALVLSILPVITGGLMYLTSPDYIGLLFTDETGRQILGGAVLSLLTGIGSMRFIIHKALS